MNPKSKRILAIETSCDETAAALVDFDMNSMVIKPLSSVVFSQIDIHKKYGGVFPELASREHIKKIKPVVEEAMQITKIQETPLRPHWGYEGQARNKQITNSKIQTDVIARKATAGRSNLISGDDLANFRAFSGAVTDIDAIAVTVGPGLIGSLIVGVEFARGLAAALDKPVIPINHLEGHVYSCLGSSFGLSLRGTPKQSHQIARLDSRQSRLAASACSPAGETPPPRKLSHVARRNDIIFPALALIVSGGHTLLVLMRDHLDYKIIGTTLDDAAGECFDKIARMLGLPYPGGPALSKLAEKGDAKAFDFPRSMINSGDFNFSFSGLKTAVFYKLRDLGLVDDKAEPITPFSDVIAPKGTLRVENVHGRSNLISRDNLANFSVLSSARADVAASAQRAIVDVLVKKTFAAAKKYKVKSILVGGGVSANSALRQAFGCHSDRSSSEAEGSLTHLRASVPIYLSPIDLAGDNALSIAIAACYRYQNGDTISWKDLEANSSLKLTNN